MTNQFFGFSPESFEQFIRALALEVFGQGVTAFGNGPDGGREATFSGRVPYPFPPASQWSGYGVIQAKCKEKSETSAKDQRWALDLLDAELREFVASKTRTPKPQFYVFAVNVELSSIPGGGKDKAEQILESFRDKLPLRDYSVWDANQLTALLDKHATLRRRFQAYLTPGDVLAEMLALIETKQPNASRILTSFLERELRADENARLDQAGNRTEEQLRLANLFFDLPASHLPQLTPPAEAFDEKGNLPPGVLTELIHAGSQKLDPKALYEIEASKKTNVEALHSRYILLGGPGSGKSTLGQFLAQIHRASLLSRAPEHRFEVQTRQIIRQTIELCDTESIPLPPTPRYPFRVELNRFAKSLASKDKTGVETLDSYLLAALKRDFVLSHEDLLAWLSNYPWLLILDGLDEVPSSSNRSAVVECVNNFLALARQSDADLFVVATSRQQGYNSEFANPGVGIRHICPLSRERALRYVKRYASARFGGESGRAEEVLESLQRTAKRDLTVQLMSSPLQVTFMATVVAARGDPGEDRWQLFDSYYRTIYDRERQKAVPPYDLVLSKQQPTIDRLHHDIGFWLQYLGETHDGAPATLSIQVFERLVDKYLTDLGREGAEKQVLVQQITGAARHRLVFLASKSEGELSFDVRSLQEYMASECIMTGEPDIINSRLKAIAPSRYWRNVFLFSASKCFVDARSRYLQDSIRVLCEDLNRSPGPYLEDIKSGSDLALDILQSGAVAENPNYARHLARLGLELLAEPDIENESFEGASVSRRLASVYRETLHATFVEQIRLRLGQKETNDTLGAWVLLLSFIAMGKVWATALGEQFWPKENCSQIKVLEEAPERSVGSAWIRERALPAVWATDPRIVYATLRRFNSFRKIAYGEMDLLRLLGKMMVDSGDGAIAIRVAHRGHQLFRASIKSVFGESDIDQIWQLSKELPNGHAGWSLIDVIRRFRSNPTALTLAGLLEELADEMDCGMNPWLGPMCPWPLAECLRSAKDIKELRETATRVRGGQYGDENEWFEIERVWEHELFEIGTIREGFPRLEGGVEHVCGFPSMFTMITSSSIEPNFRNPSEMLEMLNDLPASNVKCRVANMMFNFSEFEQGLVHSVDPAKLGRLLEQGCEVNWWSVRLGQVPTGETRGAWIDVLNKIGESCGTHSFAAVDDASVIKEWAHVLQIEVNERAAGAEKNNEGNLPYRGLFKVVGRLAADGAIIDNVRADILASAQDGDISMRLAACLVRLSRLRTGSEDVMSLVASAGALFEPSVERGVDDVFFRACESHLIDNELMVEFVSQFMKVLPSSLRRGRARCERLLRRSLAQRPSEVSEFRRLELLRFPDLRLGL